MSWNMENSTRLGSIRMYFSSSGVAWKSMPAISALMQTLFPDPVAPAISRCGMRGRSAALQNDKTLLSLAIGTDVSGNTVVGDLTRMPALLIGGAARSGKHHHMKALPAGILVP